ncbi:fimbria/pilus outer membrane usher protein, partial [Klebsiella pneumoniae]
MRHGPVHTVTVVSLSILLGGQSALLHAQATFNMDLLEKNDHLPAVDLQRFNQQAGQPPGAYPVSWQVNGVTLDARKTVTFRQNDRGQLTPCLKPEDLLQAGVNPAVLSQAPGATSRSCPELNALLPGSTVNFDFAHQRLVMTIPQALMTHRARDNVPSALWDEGISAFQSNYRYSGASQRTREGSTERDNYLMLKSGVNVGAWRLRASNSLTANSDDKPQWTTSGAWLERDLTRWQSELTLGDTFTSGDVFDAVQFQGISLASSDAMLPDSQKGFAPTIRGIARTNAQVTVRQNGYVLYQTYVTPGAFVIDDLYPTASSGNLEVAVKESDGEIRRFTQPYASVTSMQREGSLKYNLVAGRYHSDDASQRPLMMQLSLMRGFAHNLTLFGGLQSAAQYHNLSLGAGQGLGEAGALSLQLLNARDRHQ